MEVDPAPQPPLAPCASPPAHQPPSRAQSHQPPPRAQSAHLPPHPPHPPNRVSLPPSLAPFPPVNLEDLMRSASLAPIDEAVPPQISAAATSVRGGSYVVSDVEEEPEEPEDDEVSEPELTPEPTPSPYDPSQPLSDRPQPPPPITRSARHVVPAGTASRGVSRTPFIPCYVDQLIIFISTSKLTQREPRCHGRQGLHLKSAQR